jgi:4-hydroxybenzoate polyprenyltransferase
VSGQRADAGSPPASASAPTHTPARGGWRAWAELLRAPLLLSPIADVLAGWSIGVASTRLMAQDDPHPGPVFAEATRVVSPALACAAVAGVCLLAAGMAQNALADQRDDAERKPLRPLPRGALSRAAVWIAWSGLSLAGLGLAASVSRPAMFVALGILALTAAYHVALKRFRLPGCLALGGLRALDLSLGACVAKTWLDRSDGAPSLPYPTQWTPVLAVMTAAFYALFMAGASLHASTDDEAPGGKRPLASRFGVGLHLLALAAFAGLFGVTVLGRFMLTKDNTGLVMAAPALGLACFAFVRAWRAARSLPPGPLTGVLLSGLYLFDAIACLAHRTLWIALLSSAFVLALFAASRRMRRAFPPT